MGTKAGGHWRVGLTAAVLVAACAQSPSSGPPLSATGGAAGTGSAGAGSGGATAPGTGGAVGTGGDGGTGGRADAGVFPAMCGRLGALWEALEDAEMGAVRLGYCLPQPGATTGALVFDGDGRLVDVTGMFRSEAPAKSDWLAMFAVDLFPCWAGMTIEYACMAD
jgi:hypothetical protein